MSTFKIYHLSYTADITRDERLDVTCPTGSDDDHRNAVDVAGRKGAYVLAGTITVDLSDCRSADGKGYAFQASQNIDTNWAEGQRSTSIGDIIVDDCGDRYIVASVGFIPTS